jgi:hypothetical protein
MVAEDGYCWSCSHSAMPTMSGHGWIASRPRILAFWLRDKDLNIALYGFVSFPQFYFLLYDCPQTQFVAEYL